MRHHIPVLCFGIIAGEKRSAYWRVRSGTRRPELFIEREDHGAVWHLSLHESGRWHLKLRGEERVHWIKPGEIAPGFTRAVGIVLPVTVIHKEIPAPVDLRLIAVDEDSKRQPSTSSSSPRAPICTAGPERTRWVPPMSAGCRWPLA